MTKKVRWLIGACLKQVNECVCAPEFFMFSHYRIIHHQLFVLQIIVIISRNDQELVEMGERKCSQSFNFPFCTVLCC